MDLSASTATPPLSSASVGVDVSVRTFAAEVLKASQDKPVLVDFWAPWCAPCKQLMPLLDKIVAATKGAVKLAKVNIDENQQLAAQMGIQSIPAVYAFYKGQPVDGFMGVQPEGAIRSFVDALIEAAGGQGGSGIPDLLAAAEEALKQGQVEEANALYAEVLEQENSNAPAYAGLMRVALHMGLQSEAEAMFAEAAPTLQRTPELQAVKAQMDLLAQAEQNGLSLIALQTALDADHSNHQARYDLALALYSQGQIEASMEALLTLIKLDRTWNDDAARKQLLVMFEALGSMDSHVIAARRKLSSLLFK